MGRFDVYANPGRLAADTPYLLDVQSDLLAGLETRVVIPLRRRDRFADVDYLLETPKLGAVPKRVLKQPVLSLAEHRDTITRALDFLFQGF